jgi:hypothetical protein
MEKEEKRKKDAAVTAKIEKGTKIKIGVVSCSIEILLGPVMRRRSLAAGKQVHWRGYTIILQGYVLY